MPNSETVQTETLTMANPLWSHCTVGLAFICVQEVDLMCVFVFYSDENLLNIHGRKISVTFLDFGINN